MLVGLAVLKRRPACLKLPRLTETYFASFCSRTLSSIGHLGEEAMPERSICLAQVIPAMLKPQMIIGLDIVIGDALINARCVVPMDVVRTHVECTNLQKP